ncbi:GNAT family N-acetyltransferase [Gorillibacterium sp. sgz5001074]|uniref:GNAT family N-acetyltransferase n=1 Tax=Gorillibacterium sp. sgz5001074 TaxID=3446695 RepID=UPI003F669EF8
MILLEPREYGKALEPLQQVKINTMFAEAVVRCRIPGLIYADCAHDPNAFCVFHPYGMSLLFGRTERESFHRSLQEYLTNADRTRTKPEWLQADPMGDWTERIERLPGIERHTRVNFRFNPERYADWKRSVDEREPKPVRTSAEMFRNQTGSVVARNFWQDADQFMGEGIGYSLIIGGETASTAFSAFIDQKRLEIGIETSESHRGQGYAARVSSALIDDILQRGLEPVWSCRLENVGSYRLAIRLGFEPVLSIPYYRLVQAQ